MDWQYICPESGADDVDLKKLLVSAPGFLDADDPGGSNVRAVAPAPGSSTGRILASVDRDGQVELVVCASGADAGELSALLGDILATGARLWHQPFDVLARPMVEALGSSLTKWMTERNGDGWSASAFENGVAQSLGKGHFPVILVSREVSDQLKEMAEYLETMSMKVRVQCYDYKVAGGVEFLQPIAPGRANPVRTAPSNPKPSAAKPAPVQPRASAPASSSAPSVPPAEASDQGNGKRPPFPANGVSPEQKQVLERLVELDELGLVRRGFEYMVPGSKNGDEVEGAIVVAVDKDRWPFPKKPEVVVVVNTGPDYMAGYLNLSPEEIEDFLSSLPRVQRKEHKGCLLLRASNVQEADQLVNELRALRAVAQPNAA
jgi:hypothetical protein